jgi:hypothetical protein
MLRRNETAVATMSRSGSEVAQEWRRRPCSVAVASHLLTAGRLRKQRVCETSRLRAARASPGNNKTSWRQLSLMSTCGLRLEVWWPWNRMTNDVPDPMTQRRTCSSSLVPTPNSSQLQLHVEPFAFTPLHSTRASQTNCLFTCALLPTSSSVSG